MTVFLNQNRKKVYNNNCILFDELDSKKLSGNCLIGGVMKLTKTQNKALIKNLIRKHKFRKLPSTISSF